MDAKDTTRDRNAFLEPGADADLHLLNVNFYHFDSEAIAWL